MMHTQIYKTMIQEFITPTETTDLIREVLMLLIGLASRLITLRRIKKEKENSI